MKVVRGRDAHLYKRHSSASSYSLSSSSHSINHYFKQKYKNTCTTTATLSSSSDHIHRYFKYKYKKYRHKYNTILLVILINRSCPLLFPIQIQTAENATLFNSFSLPSVNITVKLARLQRHEFFVVSSFKERHI